MLLPDNMHPELSIYYNGAIVLEKLKKNPQQKLLDLYQNIKEENDISFSIFILSLDWLYLIDLVELNARGEVFLCSLNH